MKLPEALPVKVLAELLDARLHGNTSLKITGINEIHQVEAGDLTFVDHPKYYDQSLQSAASAVIIDKKVKAPKGKALLVHPQPFQAYNQLVLRYRPFRPLQTTVHESAVIDPSAVVEPGAIIGPEVRIGKNCHIQAQVVIAEHTVIGNRVIVQSGSVIGTDAFYFKKTDEGYVKWRSGGRVILEDDVDIGAGCTINKGVSGDTVIGEGTKLDGQVHIGHDVRVGKRCLFAAQVGIGGNTVIGDEVVLYGQAGIAQNLTVGDRAVVLAKSGVSKNLEAGKVYFGYPAGEARSMYRELAALRHLPEFFGNYYQ